MYRLTLTWLLEMLGFLVLAGCVMAAGLWVRDRRARESSEARPEEGESHR
jgi:hypothetical protein